VALEFLAPAPPEGEVAEEEQAESTLAPALYYEMTPNFTINFNVNGRQRYLQAAITLLYRDPLLEELLKLHMPAIRNGLVMLLSAKNFEELQTNEGKEILRKEALEIIRSQLQKEQEALVTSGKSEEVSPSNVEQVLFTNFVMQ
jgi:flagellar FliL protein